MSSRTFCRSDIRSESKCSSQPNCKETSKTQKTSGQNIPMRHLRKPTERQETKKAFLASKRKQEKEFERECTKFRDDKIDSKFFNPVEFVTQFFEQPYQAYCEEMSNEEANYYQKLYKAEMKDYNRTMDAFYKRKLYSKDPLKLFVNARSKLLGKKSLQYILDDDVY